MRIAIPYETETGTIYQHFGHAKAFKLYDVQDGAVEKSEEISAQGSGHGALADLLKENHVDALICGGIGAGAIEALKNAAILVCAGVKGAADEAVAQHLAGTLGYTTQANCSHHGADHAEGGHRCSHAHGHGEDAPRCSHAHAHSHGHGRGGEGGHRCPHAHGGSEEQQK